MQKSSDILIVGGGVTGLMTALHLRERERGVDRVTIVERHFVGSGQSHRAAGVARASVRDATVARALLESIEFFTTFEERFGQHVTFHRAGYLFLAEQCQSAAVDWVIAAATEAGCRTGLISGSEAGELQSGLRQDDGTLYSI
jgi:glycine/D-amino acid oxidase-like deaminating enzyme